MTHSPREVYLLMSSRYLSETVLHDWSLPIPSCSSPLFKAALSFEANEHPSGSGSCRRDFCLPSFCALFASVQSFFGLHCGVQLPLCPRKCCEEGGCQEQPWGLAGSKVSFNCTEFQGHPKRMERGGQVLGVPGHRGLPGGCYMSMSSGRAYGNGEDVSLMGAGAPGRELRPPSFLSSWHHLWWSYLPPLT